MSVAIISDGYNCAMNGVLTVHGKVTHQLSRVNPLLLIGATAVGTCLFLRVRTIIRRSDRPLHKRLKAYAFSWFRCIPAVRERISSELDKTAKELGETIHERDQSRHFVECIQQAALTEEEIIAKMAQYLDMGGQFDYKRGRVSGTVYTDVDEKHMALLSRVFTDFAYSNPLHPDVFPAVRKMEAEVIRMVANLFSGPADSCGTVTTGGTESIILACLSSRNHAISRRGIADPVIVAPVTAHAAFDKACSLLGMRIRHVAVDGHNGRVDIQAMRRAIDDDVCLLVGSAPNFPFGTVDDVPAIAALGRDFGIPVHVDACLGGFIVAFARDSPALAHIPPFDFSVPGVTSISCDTHKYGYAPKGTSVVLYRCPELLHQQYFCVTEWPGGIYATPTLSGSRSGLSIALTWATLLHFGKGEYTRRANLIASKTAILADAIEKIPALHVVGTPGVSVVTNNIWAAKMTLLCAAFWVAFSSDEFNIYAVGDRLHKLGWNLNSLQMPDSIHFCLTYNQTFEGVIEAFLEDLKRACEEVATLPDKGKNSKTAAIYGLAAQIPDKSVIEEVAHLYLDACYSKPPQN